MLLQHLPPKNARALHRHEYTREKEISCSKDGQCRKRFHELPKLTQQHHDALFLMSTLVP